MLRACVLGPSLPFRGGSLHRGCNSLNCRGLIWVDSPILSWDPSFQESMKSPVETARTVAKKTTARRPCPMSSSLSPLPPRWWDHRSARAHLMNLEVTSQRETKKGIGYPFWADSGGKPPFCWVPILFMVHPMLAWCFRGSQFGARQSSGSRWKEVVKGHQEAGDPDVEAPSHRCGY